jgi:hypothetical protein
MATKGSGKGASNKVLDVVFGGTKNNSHGHGSASICYAVVDGAAQVLSCGQDGKTALRDPNTLAVKKTYTGTDGIPSNFVAASPAGNLAAIAHDEHIQVGSRRIEITRAFFVQGYSLCNLSSLLGKSVFCAPNLFGKDVQHACHVFFVLQTLHLPAMELAKGVASNTLPNRALAFSPDGQQVAFGSDNADIKVQVFKFNAWNVSLQRPN